MTDFPPSFDSFTSNPPTPDTSTLQPTFDSSVLNPPTPDPSLLNPPTPDPALYNLPPDISTFQPTFDPTPFAPVTPDFPPPVDVTPIPQADPWLPDITPQDAFPVDLGPPAFDPSPAPDLFSLSPDSNSPAPGSPALPDPAALDPGILFDSNIVSVPGDLGTSVLPDSSTSDLGTIFDPRSMGPPDSSGAGPVTDQGDTSDSSSSTGTLMVGFAISRTELNAPAKDVQEYTDDRFNVTIVTKDQGSVTVDHLAADRGYEKDAHIVTFTDGADINIPKSELQHGPPQEHKADSSQPSVAPDSAPPSATPIATTPDTTSTASPSDDPASRSSPADGSSNATPSAPVPPAVPVDPLMPFNPGGLGPIEQVLDSLVNPDPSQHPLHAGIVNNLADRGKSVVDGVIAGAKADYAFESAILEGRLGDAAAQRFHDGINAATGAVTGFGHSVSTLGNAIGDIAYYGTHSDEAGALNKLGSAIVDGVLETSNVVSTADGAVGLAKGASAVATGIAAKSTGAAATAAGKTATESIATGASKATATPKTTAGGSPVAVPVFDPETMGPPSGLKIYKGKKSKVPGVKKTKSKFGPSSDEPGGTHKRAGEHFGEVNAAEISQGLRIDYDPVAGRPRSVEYRVDRTTRLRDAPLPDRAFSQDTSTLGAQSTYDAYNGSAFDRGHLAQREAFKENSFPDQSHIPDRVKVDAVLSPAEAADHYTNVVPMKPAFNRSGGIWRQAEMRTLDLADQYGAVQVRVEPVYSENPPRLSDGTPIPYEIRRTVYGPTGNVLDHIALPNL